MLSVGPWDPRCWEHLRLWKDGWGGVGGGEGQPGWGASLAGCPPVTHRLAADTRAQAAQLRRRWAGHWPVATTLSNMDLMLHPASTGTSRGKIYNGAAASFVAPVLPCVP